MKKPPPGVEATTWYKRKSEPNMQNIPIRTAEGAAIKAAFGDYPRVPTKDAVFDDRLYMAADFGAKEPTMIYGTVTGRMKVDASVESVEQMIERTRLMRYEIVAGEYGDFVVKRAFFREKAWRAYAYEVDEYGPFTMDQYFWEVTHQSRIVRSR